MRHRRRLPLEELAPYLLPLPDPPAPLDWSAVFGNDHPVEMEVGFGKGLFLLTASTKPGPTSISSASRSSASTSCSRPRAWPSAACATSALACADAALFLRDRVAAGLAAGGARLLSRPVVEETAPQAAPVHAGVRRPVSARVRPGGRLYFATDVEEYFGLMREAWSR